MNYLKKIFFIVFVIINGLTYSQGKTDTLAYARKLNVDRKFKQSKLFLENYCRENPGNPDGVWLLAQTCYWAKDMKEAIYWYEKAIKLNPDNNPLKQDYFTFLVNAGEIEKAKKLAPEFEKSGDANLILTMAKLAYFSGNYQKALGELDKVKGLRKNDPSAAVLKAQVLSIVSPSVKFNTFYQTDDQPLKQINTAIEGNYYKNSLLALNINYSNPVFMKDNVTSTFGWLRFSNKFNFYRSRAFVRVDLGALYAFNQSKSDVTFGAEAGKTFFRHLEASVKYSRQPYFFTRNSLNNLLLYNQYSAQLGWDKENSFSGKASFAANQFTNDKNYVYAFNAWILSPPLKYKILEARVGYSFNYSTSQYSKYTSRDSLSTIIANYYYSNYIAGVYNPYFTPFQQQMHFALITLKAKINSHFSASVNTNIGFYASVQNPYLYLNKDDEGSIFLSRGYTPYRFSPMEVKGQLTYAFNSRLSVTAEYLYRENNFYTSHYFGISILKSFWNE